MDPAKVLVARFLRDNNFTQVTYPTNNAHQTLANGAQVQTLDAFLAEAGLPTSITETTNGDVTVEKLLVEKAEYDTAVSFEKLAIDDGEDNGWRISDATPIVVDNLPSKSNILAVCTTTLAGASSGTKTLVVSTATKDLLLLDLDTRSVRHRLPSDDGSPILCFAGLGDRYMVTGSMSGQLALVDSRMGNFLAFRKDHTKFVVQMVTHYDTATQTYWLMTAGWDAKICLYKIQVQDVKPPDLGEPITTVTLESNPEAILFTRRPESNEPVLLLTRRDSALLYYYALEPLRLIGTQDLAPMSNSWVAFTPSAMAICPTDPDLVAIGTTSMPYMKLLLVRLLLPPRSEDESKDDVDSAQSQGRAVRLRQDRELAAIQIQCTTMAPQTQYSTPAVAWRPDGSGVWVNGDDGVIRGVERKTGKVVESLVTGHDAGTKVRCLCTGRDEQGELLISGGFDHKLIVWRV